ncbi:MAG TPA: hypothetical protein PK079_22770 [Leptospiraceae bacterium]|nr:hypothetical protein [Leptospiraceae bacterium]HMW04390.1 hypothetical protein [Leptospiraceae bacterium]HMX31040.1 hypothetical protein [Leptospiraceae bacterium]HMY34134.1 hypothetical protein [Leptospiraceae bacterium]HMZ63845.1 hypothetical protein [Leptospiraceae bacterium]
MKKFYLLILALIFVNCAKTEYFTRNVNTQIRMNSFSDEEGYKLKKRFETSHTRINLFWGLVTTINKRDMEWILASELKDPDKEAIGNLTITEYYDFLDGLVDTVLFGLIRPYSVILRGDLYERASNAPIIPEDKQNSEMKEVKDAPLETSDAKSEKDIVKDSDSAKDSSKPSNTKKGEKNVKKK